MSGLREILTSIEEFLEQPNKETDQHPHQKRKVDGEEHQDLIGTALLLSHNYSDAITSFNKAIKNNPKSATAYYERGLLYKAIDRYSLALKDFEMAIELNLQDPEVLNHRKRLRHFLHECTVDTEDSYAASAYDYLQKGIAHYYLGNYKRAIQNILKATGVKPELQSADIHYKIGVCCYCIGLCEESTRSIRRAIQLGLDNIPAASYYITASQDTLHRRRGKEILKFRKRREEKHFEKNKPFNGNIDESQKVLEQLVALGNECIDSRKYIDAINAFTQAISIFPFSGDLFFARGLSNYRSKNYHRAIDDFSTVIDYCYGEEEAEAFYHRGLSFYHLKNYSKAFDDFNTAAKLNPKKEIYLEYKELARSDMTKMQNVKRKRF